MAKYFAQDTPQAGLERMMMTVPGFKPRDGGTMILNRFHYRPEDVDCRNCLHGNVQVCILSVCPYIAERLEAGCIGFQELVEESFRDIPHAGLKKRIEAVTSWKGLSRAALQRIADRHLEASCPGWLAAVYLLASSEHLWKLAVSAITPGSIAFSKISLKGISTDDYPLFRAAKGLYNGRFLLSASELADKELVNDSAFRDIICAALIARYGKAVISLAKEAVQ